MSLRISNASRLMRWLVPVIACLWIAACGFTDQPESVETVAAYEIPLPSQTERERFLSVLRDVAENYAMHVDSATHEELEQIAKAGPNFRMTMNASVWRGANDEESIASAMDQPDHLGQVWISFARGEDPALNNRFRESAMSRIMQNWPETLSLPIMPTGAIPLHRDLIKTQQGYVVNPTEAHKYAIHDKP